MRSGFDLVQNPWFCKSFLKPLYANIVAKLVGNPDQNR